MPFTPRQQSRFEVIFVIAALFVGCQIAYASDAYSDTFSVDSRSSLDGLDDFFRFKTGCDENDVSERTAILWIENNDYPGGRSPEGLIRGSMKRQFCRLTTGTVLPFDGRPYRVASMDLKNRTMVIVRCKDNEWDVHNLYAGLPGSISINLNTRIARDYWSVSIESIDSKEEQQEALKHDYRLKESFNDPSKYVCCVWQPAKSDSVIVIEDPRNRVFVALENGTRIETFCCDLEVVRVKPRDEQKNISGYVEFKILKAFLPEEFRGKETPLKIIPPKK